MVSVVWGEIREGRGVVSIRQRSRHQEARKLQVSKTEQDPKRNKVSTTLQMHGTVARGIRSPAFFVNARGPRHGIEGGLRTPKRSTLFTAHSRHADRLVG